jgi:hypothetical protein
MFVEIWSAYGVRRILLALRIDSGQVTRRDIESGDSRTETHYPETPKRVFFDLHDPSRSDAIRIQIGLVGRLFQDSKCQSRELAWVPQPELVLPIRVSWNRSGLPIRDA